MALEAVAMFPRVPHEKWSRYILLNRMTNSQMWWSLFAASTLGREEAEPGGQAFNASFSYLNCWREVGKGGKGKEGKRE